MDKSIPLLERIARGVERNNVLLERLIQHQPDDESAVHCPSCNSADIDNTSTMGNPRLTCFGCGGSWTPKLEEMADA